MGKILMGIDGLVVVVGDAGVGGEVIVISCAGEKRFLYEMEPLLSFTFLRSFCAYLFVKKLSKFEVIANIFGRRD